MSFIDDILVCLFCMLVVAFLSGIETGVIAIHRLRLRHLVRKGDHAATIIQGYLDDPDRLFGTTLVGTNLGVVIVSVLATDMVENVPGRWAEILASAVVALALLVFSEYLPKAWFYSKPMERSRRFVRLLQFSELLLRPIAVSVVWVTKFFVPGPSGSFAKAGPFITKEEMESLLSDGEKHGVISSSRRIMIHKVFELSAKTAGQIMIPREKMTVAAADMTIPEFMDIARESHHTRMPVIDKQKRDFVGIINSLFVASAESPAAPKTVGDYVRKPMFVFESTRLAEILPLLRRSRQPMCLVINQKSEVTGLVTSEDIVRGIVGSPRTAA
jgi:putative hemolysin